jgi:hypothetical protein
MWSAAVPKARGCPGLAFVSSARSLGSVARDHRFRREPIVQAKAEDIVAQPRTVPPRANQGVRVQVGRPSCEQF